MSHKTVSIETLRLAFEHSHDQSKMAPMALPRELRGDNLRLKQTLINLTKNALKFSLQGSIRLIMAYDGDAEMLHVHVHDTGKGIKEEEMPKLFSLFGKLRRTAEQNHEGIGMGLMICQKLVEMNHGSIEVFSKGEN